MKHATAFLLMVVAMVVLAASEVHAGSKDPWMSQPVSIRKYFDPDKFVTTGGIKYEPEPHISIAPQFGLGYSSSEREIKSGYDDVLHRVHAQAGGRLNMFRHFYISAGAKLPVYAYESSDRRIAGDITQPVSSRQSYDFLKLPTGNYLTWTGEMGFNLSHMLELNLFYDQDRLDAYPDGSSVNRQEDRFGTRFIFRF